MLLQRNVNPYVLNILQNWFSKSNATVKYNNNCSAKFQLSSDVRQGSKISPLLFSIYVDKLLDTLDGSGLGCHIDGKCFNSFMYADDLIIISPSVKDLQLIFNKCEIFFNSVDLPINADKCKTIRIGPRYQEECSSISIENISILLLSETPKILANTEL